MAYARSLRGAHIALGKHLATYASGHGAPVLAVADAGAIPYYSGWRAVDTLGLNDAHIAVSGLHDPEYVLSRSPDLVVLISSDRGRLEPHVDWEGILYTACIKSGMRCIKVLEFAPGKYYLWLLAYPESDVAKHVTCWHPQTAGYASPQEAPSTSDGGAGEATPPRP